MPQAARVGDPISHTNAFPGLIAGAIAGAVIGAAVVTTGGVAAIALGACAGVGLGGIIGEFAAGFTTTITGMIVSGSLDTTTNLLPSAKVGDRVACAWHGGTQLIAEGSRRVGINGFPAARVGDRTTCGAQIAAGSGNTIIGGPSLPILPINPEVPVIAELLVGAIGMVAGVGEIALAEAGARSALAARLGIGLAAATGGGLASSFVGGKIFGEGSRGQRQMALGGGLLAGGLGAGLAGDKLDPFGFGSDDVVGQPTTGLTSADVIEAHRDVIANAETFKPSGMSDDEIDEYLASEKGSEFLKTIKDADPTADSQTIYDRANSMLGSGSSAPDTIQTPDSLVKIVPGGNSVSPYSPYFTTQGELDNALSSGTSLPDYFGLPINSEAENYDIYQITPNAPTNVYVSQVAPTSELGGLVTRPGGAMQYVVPNRQLWSAPELIGSIGGH